MVNDYRNTKYCKTLESLSKKKQVVADLVKEAHPRAKDMHAYIKVNSLNFKTEFMKAYNFKCCYCGASIDILPREMFEIDHFIYKKYFASKAQAGFIENLVLACHTCNHQKSSIMIDEKVQDILNPDLETIKEVFRRDEKYYIVVDEKILGNEMVVYFYKKLGLNSEVHRLDYLLMNMLGLQRTLEGDAYMKFGQAIDILRLKRNLCSNASG